MPNFLSVTLTSGTTSQPEEEETVVNLTTEEEQQDTTDLLILLKLQLLWYLKGLYNWNLIWTVIDDTYFFHDR